VKITTLCVAALALGTIPASAAFPDRPVRIVVPFGAGGNADITARIVADKLGERLGQRFIIDNQPGPGGMAAARSTLSAPHDGYTTIWLHSGTPAADEGTGVRPAEGFHTGGRCRFVRPRHCHQ
jgi:tripartite-type tricarboxylate transporter receptor subunit TctC